MMHLVLVSMRQPEVEPLVPLVGSSLQVMCLLLCRHRVPLFIAAGIAPDVVYFGQEIDEDVHHDQAHQNAVPAVVSRCIVYSFVSDNNQFHAE